MVQEHIREELRLRRKGAGGEEGGVRGRKDREGPRTPEGGGHTGLGHGGTEGGQAGLRNDVQEIVRALLAGVQYAIHAVKDAVRETLLRSEGGYGGSAHVDEAQRAGVFAEDDELGPLGAREDLPIPHFSGECLTPHDVRSEERVDLSRIELGWVEVSERRVDRSPQSHGAGPGQYGLHLGGRPDQSRSEHAELSFGGHHLVDPRRAHHGIHAVNQPVAGAQVAGRGQRCPSHAKRWSRLDPQTGASPGGELAAPSERRLVDLSRNEVMQQEVGEEPRIRRDRCGRVGESEVRRREKGQDIGTGEELGQACPLRLPGKDPAVARTQGLKDVLGGGPTPVGPSRGSQIRLGGWGEVLTARRQHEGGGGGPEPGARPGHIESALHRPRRRRPTFSSVLA